MSGTLGVLITYHGEREVLTECLASLTGRPGSPEEIIVYDDASEAPAKDYVPSGAGVNVIRGQRTIGPGRGRNVLLAASRADYVHFHDADDLFHPDWSARVRSCLGASVDAVFTEISSEREGTLVCERVLGLGRLGPSSDLVEFALSGSILTPAGTYRRGSVLRIGGYREDLWQSEDFDFHVRLAVSGLSYRCLDDPLVRIRIRREGRSSDRVSVWADYSRAVEMLANELDPRYRPHLADAARRAGAALLQLGAAGEARRALMLADALGPGLFADKRMAYRVLARMLGIGPVERLACLYHGLVPDSLRSWLTLGRWA